MAGSHSASALDAKTCRKCGAKFIGRQCKPCRNEYVRRWNAENPDKAKAASKKYNDKNREKNAIRAKTWYEENKNRGLATRKIWRQNNAAKMRSYALAFAAQNKDRLRLYSQRSAIKNAANRRLDVINRRARIRNNGGRLSKGLVQRLLREQKAKCACCRTSLRKAGYHLDHIVPVSAGGPNVDSNIQLLCPSCNQSKGAKDPLHFMQSRGFLL